MQFIPNSPIPPSGMISRTFPTAACYSTLRGHVTVTLKRPRGRKLGESITCLPFGVRCLVTALVVLQGVVSLCDYQSGAKAPDSKVLQCAAMIKSLKVITVIL